LEKLLGMAESNCWGRRMIEILALRALALELRIYPEIRLT